MLRHKVRAGVTGWAQVHGWRGDTSLHERVEHDIYYIQNWSLALDLRILLMTLWRAGCTGTRTSRCAPSSTARADGFGWMGVARGAEGAPASADARGVGRSRRGGAGAGRAAWPQPRAAAGISLGSIR